MNNSFKVYDLISENIYTQNILGSVNFDTVPKVSGNNFIYSLGGVGSVLKLTQGQYNELTPNQDTLYIITE